nr:hypothetical protein C4D60_Mb07t17560 [Ipomoea batatas]
MTPRETRTKIHFLAKCSRNTANPTVPKPKIATVDPGSTFAALIAAPTLDTPQLRRQARLGGMLGSIFVRLAMSITVYSLKLDTNRKWCKASPLRSVNRLVSSLCRRGEALNGNFVQRLLFLDLQSKHSVQSGKNIGTTESPSLKSSTSSPTLSTILNLVHIEILGKHPGNCLSKKSEKTHKKKKEQNKTD